MNHESAFTEAQKQYLSGFAFGADVARAVHGLPVISQSQRDGSGSTITVGGGAATIDGRVLPDGPQRAAIEAQDRVLAAGKKLSKEEQAKREKNPLDMWDEIQARCDQGKFPTGTDVFLQKFHGLFYVTPAQDSYMLRMRLPGGVLHAWQLRGLADLCVASGGGNLDVTTRANLQIREIPADQAMNILYGIGELGIVSLGSGGDNIRNCTASCLSGIDETESIATIPLAKRMHHAILNRRDLYGLPRKFNIAFEGGGKIASLEDTNDIGFRAVRVPPQHATEDLPAGVYFQLTLGGITGHQDFARTTGVLLTERECIDVAVAIVRVFIRSGDRTDRKKARLKYVLDAWGFDKFIAEVQQELGRPLRRVPDDHVEVPRNEDRSAHVGVHRQPQPELNYIGLVLPVGRMTADQARVIADIAQDLGRGELRLTVWQNLIIPHIHDADVEEAKRRIVACGLDYRATAVRAGLIACTGSAGCKFAGADTKADAIAIAHAVDRELTLDRPINIHVTGCHHSCAQHYIGDIGLIGCKVERGDDMVDGYHIVLGGGWGERQAIGRTVFESIPADEAPACVTAILAGYLRCRDADEDFNAFVARRSIPQLRELVQVAV